MRAVLQRATSASVTVEGEVVARIDEPGLVVLLGITHDDGLDQVTDLVGTREGGLRGDPPVSYTHLTLPTNREV